MTLDELLEIREILIVYYALARFMGCPKGLEHSLVVVNREIILKTMDPRKTFGDVGTNDPNGNLITGP